MQTNQFHYHSGIKWITKRCQSTVTLGFIVQCVIRYERFAFDKFQIDVDKNKRDILSVCL